jgi:hypothetical protein
VIYQKYFHGARRQGSRDPDFLDKLNGVFICFVATAVRHCLKAWKTGECAESGPDFKYETNWGKFVPDPSRQMCADIARYILQVKQNVGR